MPDLVQCPDPDCQAPAEIVDRWTWASTGGPLEHVRTCCLARHVFTPVSATLVAIPEQHAPEAVPAAS